MSVIDTLQLNQTEMFAKIRADLLPKHFTNNLLESKDDLLFAWDQTNSCILVVNWRLISLKNIQYQTLVPSAPQNFDVERLIISNEGSLLALVGPRGVAVVELPRRWGKDGQYMDGKPIITCRTYCLDALLFGNNPHLEVRQVRWHSGSTTDSHLLVLLSDNTIRLYNNSQLRHVWQVGPLPSKGTHSKNNSSISTFGETAVDFDIAPAVKLKSSQSGVLLDSNSASMDQSKLNRSQVSTKIDKIEWPLVILRENGNIYILVTGLNSEKTRLQGPITITPQTFDNYGLDSCSLLVIPSVPPTLVIAESSGKLHHALLLELDSAETSFNEIDESLNIEPSEWSIHVLETVELELGLPKHQCNESQGEFTCPIHLKRDIINELRYFAYHNTGLHVVTLNFIGEVQRYLSSEAEDDKVSLTTPSSAEYIICTKVDTGDRINAVLGFVILQMPSSLVLLLNSGQVISLKVLVDTKLLANIISSPLNSEDPESKRDKPDDGPSFAEHIRSLLQRNLTQPILSADKTSNPTPHECYELLKQAIDVLRVQYLKRHDDVRAEFCKRISLIRLQKEQQLREIESLERERDLIRERAHKFAERFEEINDNQDILMRKCHDLMRQANLVFPGNVAAEKEFSTEVAIINKATKCMATAMEHAQKSIEKQRYHIAKGNATTNRPPFELPEKHHNTISDILTQMASEIERQIKDVKRVNKLIGI